MFFSFDLIIKLKNMKKLLPLVTLVFTGLVSAKNSDTNFSLKKEEKENISKILRYAYLYQSTCGWTFNMYTEVPVGQMTDEEYDDYIDELISKNDYVCKIHGIKPIEGYVQKDTLGKLQNKI
jgi:hypothetical protein